MAQPVLASPPALLPLTEPSRESRFAYMALNMDYTLRAWNDLPSNPAIRLAHRIAEATLFPVILIAALESVFKNGLFLIANLGIAAANTAHHIFCHPAQTADGGLP